MKHFAFILSLYIMVLAVIPCIDLPEDHSLQKVELSKTTTGSHPYGDDCCSPFCTCYCCTTPLIIQDCSVQFNFNTFILKQVTVYTFSYISSFSDSIWQPPKVS